MRLKKEVIAERDCIFCKIAHGETPADIVCQGDELVAFKDISPSAPVHVLVIPKKHVRSINDLKDEDRDLISEMFLMAKKIIKVKGTDHSGYKLIFNVKKGGRWAIGLSPIPHLPPHDCAMWNWVSIYTRH